MYFGIRFRPISTVNIDAPEELVSALDLAAAVMTPFLEKVEYFFVR